MNSEITGKIIVVGDNIDTDQIYPGCYLALTDPKEIGSHCLSGVDENIAANFPQGGIVVAGRNFGCGSSREHAPIAIKAAGISCVIAKGGHRRFLRPHLLPQCGQSGPCSGHLQGHQQKGKRRSDPDPRLRQGRRHRAGDRRELPLRGTGRTGYEDPCRRRHQASDARPLRKRKSRTKSRVM